MVYKLTTSAIGTKSLFIEIFALLGFIIFGDMLFLSLFNNSMSERTLHAININME
jgi:hypothetical protein